MQVKFPLLAGLAIGGLLLNQRRHRSVAVEYSTDDFHRTSKGIPLATMALLSAGGYLLSRGVQRSRHGHEVTESIELDVPVSTAYNQWTQFEDFPKFMPTVQEVHQVDDTHLHWKAIVAGKPKEWDSEITEQIPDQRIAWRSTSGVGNSGMVSFHPMGPNRSRIELRMHYQPQSLGEQLGDAVGGVKLTTKGNLKRFKDLVESRGMETGAWRGTVPAH